MPNKVILSADRTCDLNEALMKRYHVNYMHGGLMLDNKNHTDCIDIFPQDLYEAYWQRGSLPKTAAINTAQYLERFHGWTEQGYEVVHINLSSALSGSYQNACIAASELKGVYPVDSHNLSSAMGLLVIEAALRIEAGLPGAQVAQEVTALTPYSHASFVMDTLEFMKAGGRCSALTAAGANLLNLKPCIEVNNSTGAMGVGKKYRGNMNKVLLQYAQDRLERFKDSIKRDRVFITHSGIEQEKLDLVVDFLKKSGQFNEIHITNASCTIASHCGPGTLGVLFMTE